MRSRLFEMGVNAAIAALILVGRTMTQLFGTIPSEEVEAEPDTETMISQAKKNAHITNPVLQSKIVGELEDWLGTSWGLLTWKSSEWYGEDNDTRYRLVVTIEACD